MEPRDCIAKRERDERERIIRQTWEQILMARPIIAYGKPGSDYIYFWS